MGNSLEKVTYPKKEGGLGINQIVDWKKACVLCA